MILLAALPALIGLSTVLIVLNLIGGIRAVLMHSFEARAIS